MMMKTEKPFYSRCDHCGFEAKNPDEQDLHAFRKRHNHWHSYEACWYKVMT
jgi:hypothetical protein